MAFDTLGFDHIAVRVDPRNLAFCRTIEGIAGVRKELPEPWPPSWASADDEVVYSLPLGAR